MLGIDTDIVVNLNVYPETRACAINTFMLSVFGARLREVGLEVGLEGFGRLN